VQALQLGFGSLTSPGAGLWPFFFGAVLVVLAAVMIVTRKSETWPEPFARSSLMVVGAVLLMTFFISVLPVVGFEIPLFLLLLLWARFIGKESWRYGLLLGLFGTAAFVLIFSLALGLPLPRLIG
ncbi:tripartite tricarboxylate transporter TctB family protein, partial [Nesterenkonia massiliensis]|uniref:tripartite tricarboxylate transporter TctB family protein n=1 Tax=Nesterenkonia massiliensis TaxID=1232429 RepID=UPI000677C374